MNDSFHTRLPPPFFRRGIEGEGKKKGEECSSPLIDISKKLSLLTYPQMLDRPPEADTCPA